MKNITNNKRKVMQRSQENSKAFIKSNFYVASDKISNDLYEREFHISFTEILIILYCMQFKIKVQLQYYILKYYEV